jgi:hypothetical protein
MTERRNQLSSTRAATFSDVYEDSRGYNFHVWDGSAVQGARAAATDAGTFPIRRTGSTVTGYLLEQTASLTTPFWTTVTKMASTSGDQFVLTLGDGESQRYFRLHNDPAL